MFERLERSRKKAGSLFHLARVAGSPLTISVPILGGLSLCNPLAVKDMFWLGLVGLCAHLFGFSMNDIIDNPIDRTTPYRKQHPLTTDELSKVDAWIFASAQIPIATGVYYAFLNGSRTGTACLGASIILSIVYNLWSKRGVLPRFFAELALALSVGALCLFGAATQTSHIPLQSVLFACALATLLLLVNSVPSGLKDLKTDQDFGIRSFVIAAGCQITDDNRVSIPLGIWIYSAALQCVIVLSLVMLVRFFASSWPAIALMTALTFYSTLHLRMVLASPYFTAVRGSYPLLGGFYNYLSLCVSVMPWMPLLVRVLYVVLILLALAIPLRLSYHMWRNRYYLIERN